MSTFFNFHLWVPTVKVSCPLPVQKMRMQIFFFIKKMVYLSVTKEVKENLRTKHDPLFHKRALGVYVVKHGMIKTDKGQEKVTIYKGDSRIYKRHASSHRQLVRNLES